MTVEDLNFKIINLEKSKGQLKTDVKASYKTVKTH